VPADNGLWHNEEERLFPASPESASGDPKEFVEHSEFWFGMSALQHDKLLSKSQVLQKQILSVTNDAKGCSEPQAKQVEHGGRVIADEILACTPMLLISKPDRIVAKDRSPNDPTLSAHRHTADTGHAKASALKASFKSASRKLDATACRIRKHCHRCVHTGIGQMLEVISTRRVHVKKFLRSGRR